jgi:hypothetical protein
VSAQYEYEVQGRYSFGWEMVTTESTRDEALERAREYRDNDPAHAYRVIRVRIID